MNDDFFFNQPVTIDEFLDEDNIIIHGHWRKNAVLQAKLKYRSTMSRVTKTPMQPKHTTAQMLSAQILGMTQFFEIHHYPHIVDKNILKNYLLDNPQLLNKQIKYKFRDVAQVNPITLMNHLKIQASEAMLRPDTPINYLKNKNSVIGFLIDLNNDSIKYGCIQSLDLLDSDSYNRISSAMTQKFLEYLPLSLLDTVNQ
jgi:hypothetical protein